MVRGALLVCLVTAVASAQPRPPVPALVGATELWNAPAPAGFIDDPIATDDARLAYVVADAATKAELHVVTVASHDEQVVDIAPVTTHPIALQLVGSRALVIGQAEDGRQSAALVDLARKGAIVYRLGPATSIAVIARDGRTRIAVHRASPSKAGTRHEVELYAIETGRRAEAGHALELDGSGYDATLDFRVNHWAEGMTHAIGTKGGEWDRKENQRTPDTEATYDLISGKLVDRRPIEDVIAQRKRFQVLADAGGTLDFLHMTWDNTAVQIWHGGRPSPAELDQPISNYDPKSLQGIVAPDGSAWIVLKVDPVNPDAVARKKADPEYLDIFHAGPDGHAVRKARVLATGVRHRFGLLGDKFWLLERSNGSDRGGRALAIYRFP
ncbi:MAG TPA: hypothetical protein VLX92_24050 [Kofleriaceae bacterium]|nr:hypothetical protein [Kofleriaceae bacterium]